MQENGFSTPPSRSLDRHRETARPEQLIESKDADAFKQGYSKAFRAVELLSIGAFIAMSATLILGLSDFAAQAWVIYFFAYLGGMIGADFVSGIVHWAADTWGTPEWPVIGPTLIRPFREHHVDQLALTHHDFVELNGANCLISLPVLAIGLLTPIGENTPWTLFLVAGMTSLTLWVFATNQIHQWAHMKSPPRLVALLQRTGIILSYEHHQIHHKAPFLEYFSITTGWCNPLLKRTGFYRWLERVIHRLTGAIPREDDIGKKAAEVVYWN